MNSSRRLRVAALVLVTACTGSALPGPLEPLTSDEITRTSALLREKGMLDDSVAVLQMVLLEPRKDSSNQSPRRADVRLFDYRVERVTDVVVDLSTLQVVSTVERDGAIPSFSRLDARLSQRLLMDNPQWLAALQRRGLSLDDIGFQHMGPGTLDSTLANSGHRYQRVTATRRGNASPFVAPVEGLAALIDLSDKRVVEILDAEPTPPPFDTVRSIFPTNSQSASAEWTRGSQAYRIDGHTVSWRGWQFQYALLPREGLVLYNVAFSNDTQPARSILARASLAEMLVPYGDVSRSWTFRSVFDVGEFGLGSTAAQLIPGHDVPEGAARLDEVMANDRGEPVVRQDVVGIYERDGGLRWRHRNRAERARELVIRFATTVGNYDYAFNWVFTPDGNIVVEVDMTGMMQVKGVHVADPRFGAAVAPHLSAIHHQHFFSFRLDFDVETPVNRIREVEVALLPVDSTNPHGTGFEWKSTILASEREAMRSPNPAGARHWVIENAPAGDSARHSRAGYVLVPGSLPDLLAAPGSSLRKRGAFASHQLWATAFEQSERFPAGDFPGQDAGNSGVTTFAQDNVSLDGRDLVVWYTAGMTHIPRPEEWPIMPVSRLRFELRPNNFARRVAFPRIEP